MGSVIRFNPLPNGAGPAGLGQPQKAWGDTFGAGEVLREEFFARPAEPGRFMPVDDEDGLPADFTDRWAADFESRLERDARVRDGARMSRPAAFVLVLLVGLGAVSMLIGFAKALGGF